MLMRKTGRRRSGSRWEAHPPRRDRFVALSARSYVIVRFLRASRWGTSDTPRAGRHPASSRTVLASTGAAHTTIV